jgi:hypothetical protein
MDDNTPDDLAADILRGVPRIATFLREPERRTTYKVERDLIPYMREGRSIISRKSWLRQHYADPSNGAKPDLDPAVIDVLMRYQDVGAETNRQGSNTLSFDLLLEIAELHRLTNEILK